MRVLAFTKYGAMAASTRQRVLQYRPYLESHGIKIDILPLLDDGHLRRISEGRRTGAARVVATYLRRIDQLLHRRDYDALWVHCELFPYFPAVFEHLAALSRKPIIYDFDDAIFHMYDTHRSPMVRALLGHKLAPLLKSAAVCICGNAYLEEYAARYSRSTVIIPTVVDTDVYVPRTALTDPPTVGWIGSPSTWKYVTPHLPRLLPLLAETGTRFITVGADPTAQSIAGIEARRWSEATEVSDIHDMGIGIMPLPDAPWARGKCGYKLIQYMACGLPTVASPVGVNADIVIDGVTGLLAVDNGEWVTALSRLLGDAMLRKSLGAAGRQRAVSEYSLNSHAPRLLETLRRVAANA